MKRSETTLPGADTMVENVRQCGFCEIVVYKTDAAAAALMLADTLHCADDRPVASLSELQQNI